MTALWILFAIVALGYAVSRFTAAPAARGVPVSARLAEARRTLGLVVEPQAGNDLAGDHFGLPSCHCGGGECFG